MKTVLCAAMMLALSALPALADNSPSILRGLQISRKVLLDHLDEIKRHSSDAYDYVARMDKEISRVTEDGPDYNALQWRDAQARAALEESVIAQLIAGQPQAVANSSGAHCTLLASRVDGTLQPIGLYVPPSLSLKTPHPLVVILHGRGETEADIVSRYNLQELAQRDEAILLAPYARGIDDFADPASQEVYSAIDETEHAFAIDTRRIYLAGISMGGAGVFHVGAPHAERFSAFMSILGAIDHRDLNTARIHLRDKPVYVISGGLDKVIPASFGKGTVRVLRRMDANASYYEQPDSEHSLYQIMPAVKRAWIDMMNGISPNGGE